MPARIDDALLLADLRRVARKLRQETVTREEYDSYGRHASETVAPRFGSWLKALRAADLTPTPPQENNKKLRVGYLLADLQRVAKRLGRRTLTKDAYDEHGRYSAGTVARRLGSWAKALQRVGLESMHETNISSDELLMGLRRVARKLGKRTVTMREHGVNERRGARTIVKCFGSWSKALLRAGLVPGHTNNIPTPDLLADLRGVARRLGKRAVTQEQYDRHGTYRAKTIAKRIGSWPAALTVAGITPGYVRNIPLSDLLADIQRVAREIGECTLTTDAYDAHGRYCAATIAHRVGSWTKALAAAGMTPTAPQKHRDIPSADLIADLVQIARRLGRRTLTIKEYRTHGQFSGATFTRCFGSWLAALQQAGLTPTRAQKNKKGTPAADLIADLRRIAKKLGERTFTKAEYDTNGGRHASGTIAKRFGSWSGALLAAGLQPSWTQIVRSRSDLSSSLRTLASIPGLTTEDRVKVAKTLDGVRGINEETLLRLVTRMNLGPMELPSGIPSGVPFWERCIAALQKVQPDPEKLRATGVLERLGRQLHRAVALEVLGREPLSPAEERRVATELRQRKAA